MPSSLCCCRRPTPSYCATAAFLVTPPLTSLLSRCSLNRCAVAPFIVAPPVLPSSLHCRCLCTLPYSGVPLLAIFNISYHIVYNILFTILLFIVFNVVLDICITILGSAIGWWRIYLRRNSLHTDGGTDGQMDDSLIFSSIGKDSSARSTEQE
jgi:hypothetical protein